MPYIVHRGKGQDIDAAALAAIGGIQQAQRNQQIANRLGLAEKQFQFQQEQAAIGNDQRQQQIDQGQQRIDMLSEDRAFNQSRALASDALAVNRDARDQERFNMQKNAADRAAADQEGESAYYMSVIGESATPEELAVIQNAGLDIQRQAANRVLMDQELQQGQQRNAGLVNAVLQAMNPDPEQEVDPNDPMTLMLQEGLQASGVSLESQAAFRENMIGQFEKIEAMKADAKERVANVAGFEPVLEQFMATIPPEQRGILSAHKGLYLTGEIELSDFLDKWSSIERQKSGGGGSSQTPGERYFGAFASRRGTQDGLKEFDEEVDFATARDRSHEIDRVYNQSPGSQAAQVQQSADRGLGGLQAQSQETPVVSRRELVGLVGKETVDEAIRLMPKDPEKQKRFAIERAKAIVRETGADNTPEKIGLIAESLIGMATTN